MKRALGAALACMAIATALAAPAGAAAPEPDAVFTPSPADDPPRPEYVDPCGVAVDPNGAFYVSSYHTHSVIFRTWYELAIGVDPLGGPCGLALDSTGRLYVNNYHRNVERYTLAPFPPPMVEPFPPAQVGPGVQIDAGDAGDSATNPTGVAVDPATDQVYVNNRTHISRYGAGGAGPPLRIGEGSLGDGYGIAVSGFPGDAEHPSTAGRVYVPDRSAGTIKVYDPGVDLDDPVQTIDGAGLPGGGFGSLRDSAIAVDRVSGEIYVADTLAYPQYSELPEATVYVLRPDGSVDLSRHRLKYNVIDGSPVGLAVDNTTLPTQGRVYVTSGNTYLGSVVAYPPDAAAPAEPAAPARTPGARSAAQATASEISQRGNIRVSVSGRIAPRRLPRYGAAPVEVTVGGRISTTDGTLPAQLRTLEIELNRRGRLQRRGLSTCPYGNIQPGSSARALRTCRASLVGRGSFEADIVLAGSEPYPTSGRLLVFNAQRKGRPVLFGHIHAAHPFSTSFVIVFELRERSRGPFGRALFARIPRSMDSWGRLTALQMTLGRRYRAGEERRSYLSAGCPAPKGFPGALFPLARTTFAFEDGRRVRSVLVSECKTRR